ncbi:uncharacterized protein LOC121764179 [Salvia splendens]|uniref:uncharacterized protein LOC121764179 n=1 Tax=Salvia splendens TaxID=180675 RepID=UPI001C267566|nr:uncharacterized protein LOC121764179 [Salvia splendens]
MTSGSGGDADDMRRRIAEELRAYTSAETNRLIQAYLQQQQQSAVPRSIFHRAVVSRDHVTAHQRLFDDYFAEQPRFGYNFSRQRFRIHRDLFMSIVNALEHRYKYFRFREDASGRPGHSPIRKCTAIIRQLAYGGAAGMFYEYLHIGETTARDCVQHFCTGIIHIFEERYLQKPTPEDCQVLMDIHGTVHRFPDMLGNIDYAELTDWPMKMLPVLATAWPPPMYEWGYLMGTPNGSVHLPILDNKKPIFDSRKI